MIGSFFNLPNNLFYDQELIWCFFGIYERKRLYCLSKEFIFHFGSAMRSFPLSQKFLDYDSTFNKLLFKELLLQFYTFNHCFIISFLKFVAMILLQILKLIEVFLVAIIILLSEV